MEGILGMYLIFLIWMRLALFWVAIAVAVIAAVDWAVRTRRVSPFGPVGRFSRRAFDPLMRPIERRVVRMGGLPSNAPWWTLAAVVVGGLLFITLLQVLGDVLRSVLFGFTSASAFAAFLLTTIFWILRAGLLVRVLSSWFRLSPSSRWIRWSFVLTEWMLAPLRRIIPAFGGVDVTPIVAWFLLYVAEFVLSTVVSGMILQLR